jgi:hypothetical protein
VLLLLLLQACAGDVVRDILAKSGVTRYQASPYGEMQLRLLDSSCAAVLLV